MMVQVSQEAQAKRLKWAIERRFKTLPDALAHIKKFADVSLQSLTHHQNGTRGYTAHALDYARALGVNAAWLVWGSGEPEEADIDAGIPILGQVAANGETYHIWDYDPAAVFERLPIIMESAHMALPIKGDSMYPRFKEGEFAIVGDIAHDPSRYIGSDVVAQVEDGRIVIKVLETCPTGRWTLTSVNPMHKRIEDVNLDWVRPVISTLMRVN